MKIAGVRELKNKLSQYLRLVARGEVVLVSDRGEVVAQLAPPPIAAILRADRTAQGIARLTHSGKLRPGKGTPASAHNDLPRLASPVNLAAILAETRADD